MKTKKTSPAGRAAKLSYEAALKRPRPFNARFFGKIMDAERLKQIEEIYHAVLEIRPGERESFFKKVCGADETLRRNVESLLAFNITSEQFIDRPPESLAAEIFSDQTGETDLIGKKISHYKIKKLLGRGGMGEVFLAEDLELERLVAIKILPVDFSGDSDRVSRFIREAKSVSALNHPNILTIYDIGEFEKIRYIVTEYIEGQTLREKMLRKDFDLREILNIAEQIAAALSAAHSAGIVHRDIKPENVILRNDGFVKVLDFGLAKLFEASLSKNDSDKKEASTRKLDLTNPGMILGTASYMSPEQVRGQIDVDARADIWSLGVVIFEMLTGRVPFTGASVADIIASILKADSPNLSECIDDCPAELERILTKALQKRREERYQNVKDLALDLKFLKRDLEFSAEFGRVSGSSERNLTAQMQYQITSAEPAKRFSSYAAMVILLLAAVLLGGGWWYFGGFSRNSGSPEAAAFKTVEVVNWSSSPGEVYSVGTFSPDGKMIAFASTKTGRTNIWIKQTNSGEAVQITKDEFSNDRPIWSPDGEELAFFSTRGNQAGIWRIPVLGGSPKLIAAFEDGGIIPRFWSKNNLVYYESNHDIYAIDAQSAQTKRVTDFDANNVKAGTMSISPDERRVAYTTIDGEMWSVWTKNLTDETSKKLFSTETEIKNTVFHTDNQRIFYSAPVDGTFQIFVTDINAAPPKQITFAERDCFVLDVSPDGTRILYGSAKEESDIWLVNLKNAKESTAASEIDSELWASVSPDGQSIAYQSIKNLSQGNKITEGEILTRKVNSEEPAAQLVTRAFLPVWSPDGQKIAFMETVSDKYQISITGAADGGQKRLAADQVTPVTNSILPYNRLQTNDFSWSPDSSEIAYLSNKSGQKNIWVVDADGSDDRQLTGNLDSQLYLYCPLWSADGKLIAFTSKTGNLGQKPTYGVWIIETETKSSRMLTQQKAFLRLVEWTETGKKLLLVSTTDSETNGTPMEVSLFRLDTGTGEMREIIKLKDTYLYNLRLSPDKRNIAFVAHREGKDNIWLIPAMGGAEKRLTDNNDPRLYFSSLAWSPDNNTIFFGKQSRYSLLSMISNFK